jgi:prepilin-type N-terminal cleavage/methylation domain-containing protein
MEGTMKTTISRAGFTLLEMLVVIGITTLLSVVAISYTKIGQNGVALTVETSKIAELILQAKELAINTYGTTESGAKACAFGVHFDFTDPTNPTYSLFAYSVDGGLLCPSVASATEIGLVGPNGVAGLAIPREYEPSSWEISPAQGVTIDRPANDAVTDVLFYPPTPTTLVTRDDLGGYISAFVEPPETSKIYLSTTDGHNSSTISINPEGQVTF